MSRDFTAASRSNGGETRGDDGSDLLIPETQEGQADEEKDVSLCGDPSPFRVK